MVDHDSERTQRREVPLLDPDLYYCFHNAMPDPWEIPVNTAIERSKSLFPNAQKFMLEEIDRAQIGNWLITNLLARK